MYKKISLFELRPFVRYSHFTKISQSTNTRSAFDNRAIYVCDGKGVIYIKSKRYEVKSGTVLIFPAGFSYRFLLDSNQHLSFFSLNFDYTSDQYNTFSAPIGPTETEFFLPRNIIDPTIIRDCEPLNGIICLQDEYRLERLFTKMNKEYLEKKKHYIQMMSNQCSMLIFSVLRTLNNDDDIKKAEKKQNELVQQMIVYIQHHYNEEITNEQIGNEFNFSPTYLNRLMIKYTGSTLHRYIIWYRLCMAADLMQATRQLGINDIAEMVGFNDTNYFSRCFKKYYRMTPAEFMRQGDVSLLAEKKPKFDD